MSNKKKIALLNMRYDNNYGGNLQRYAMVTILQRLGYDVEYLYSRDNWDDWFANRTKGKIIKQSVKQIVLRWHIQNDIIPLVRTLNFEHQKENLDVFDFELTDEEMKAIDAININSRLRYDPDNCDFSIL